MAAQLDGEWGGVTTVTTALLSPGRRGQSYRGRSALCALSALSLRLPSSSPSPSPPSSLSDKDIDQPLLTNLDLGVHGLYRTWKRKRAPLPTLKAAIRTLPRRTIFESPTTET